MPQSPAYPNLDEGKMRKLMIILSKETKFVVALVFFGDKAWIRFSANVYNSQEDYIKMRNHLADFLKINFQKNWKFFFQTFIYKICNIVSNQIN